MSLGTQQTYRQVSLESELGTWHRCLSTECGSMRESNTRVRFASGAHHRARTSGIKLISSRSDVGDPVRRPTPYPIRTGAVSFLQRTSDHCGERIT
jgi:hypothetical protein